MIRGGGGNETGSESNVKVSKSLISIDWSLDWSWTIFKKWIVHVPNFKVHDSPSG